MTRSSSAVLRKPTAIRTAAVTMGLLTTAGAFAPAALAEETAAPTDTTDPTTTAPATTSTAPTTVLTPEPTPTTQATPTTSTEPTVNPTAPTSVGSPQNRSTTLPGGSYGTGKLYPALQAPEDAGIDPDEIDPTGAQVELSYSRLAGDPTDQPEDICTFQPGSGFLGMGAACVFPDGTDVPLSQFGDDLAYVPANSEFTLTLVKQPDSGQLLLFPGSSVTAQGHSTITDAPSSGQSFLTSVTVPLVAESGYRQIRITGGPARSEFSLCPVADGDCSAEDIGDPEVLDPDDDLVVLTGLDESGFITVTTDGSGNATFDGVHRPGVYTLSQTSAPAGQTVDPTVRHVEVTRARSLAERDTPALLELGTPVVVPAGPSTSSPAAIPPSTKPPVTSVPVAGAPGSGSPVTPSVAAASVAAGEQQTISIGGFQPNERVHGVLHSTPVDLGTVQADGNGVATFTFTVPAGFETGVHTVEMTGLTSGIVAEATFTVTAAATTSGGLASTGADVLPLLAVGGGLLAAGAAAVTVAARRRSA